MKIKKDDKVIVISGKDKGKIGKVLKVLPSRGKVLVEGVNIAKRHVKPGTISKEGGIVSIEKAVDVSNVMFYSDKDKRPIRIGYKFVEGKKKRVGKKTGEVLDK